MKVSKLLTYKTAAELLDCSPSKVQKMVLAGEIPIVKIGNETRILTDDLFAWIRRGRHIHVPENRRDDTSSEALPTKERIHAR